MKSGNSAIEHTPINWRSRFVKAGKIAASQIIPHPQNARIHPPLQRQAVAASFEQVGQIAPILININNGYLIDGAERSWLALDQPGDVELDCWYVDLTEEEHLYALATFDPITSLAGYDTERLDELLHEVNSDSPAIQQMLAQLATDIGLTPPDFQPVDMSEQPRLDQKKPITCPHCGQEFTPDG